MKIQAVKNYQTDRNNQQSFGKVIFDKRGIERLPANARRIIEQTYENIQRQLGKLTQSPEIDVLLYPHQNTEGKCSLVVVKPLHDYLSSTGFSIEELTDPNKLLGEGRIVNYLRRSLDPATALRGATTFAKRKETKPDLLESFWNINLPLPPEVIGKRFASLA